MKLDAAVEKLGQPMVPIRDPATGLIREVVRQPLPQMSFPQPETPQIAGNGAGQQFGGY